MYQNNEKITLASASPRRRKLLVDLGLSLSIKPAQIPEVKYPGEEIDNFVLRMAREKADVVSRSLKECWVVSGDTVVCVAERILGKPKDKKEALEMILSLSGRKHCVKTGYCVSHFEKNVNVVHVVSTDVWFAQISKEVAASYIKTGEPLDKAGAYGIQGVGGSFVERIAGSYSNVVGLPIVEVISLLLEHNVIKATGRI